MRRCLCSIFRAPISSCFAHSLGGARPRASLPSERLFRGQAFAFLAPGLGGDLLDLGRLQARERVFASACTRIAERRAVFFEPFVDSAQEFAFPMRVFDLAGAWL